MDERRDASIGRATLIRLDPHRHIAYDGAWKATPDTGPTVDELVAGAIEALRRHGVARVHENTATTAGPHPIDIVVVTPIDAEQPNGTTPAPTMLEQHHDPAAVLLHHLDRSPVGASVTRTVDHLLAAVAALLHTDSEHLVVRCRTPLHAPSATGMPDPLRRGARPLPKPKSDVAPRRIDVPIDVELAALLPDFVVAEAKHGRLLLRSHSWGSTTAPMLPDARSAEARRTPGRDTNDGIPDVVSALRILDARRRELQDSTS